MSDSDSYQDYLEDILQAVNKAREFTKGMDYQQFKHDDKTQFAVIRALEIVGEASNKIPGAIQENHSHIPWREMKGMRNKLIHDYVGVNTEVVWQTIQEDLPELESLIKTMKDRLDNSRT